MNKKQLVKEVAQKANRTISITEPIVNALFEVIKDEVLKGGEVKIVEFGTFCQYHAKARTRRNPQTDEPVQVPAQLKFKLRPSKLLHKTEGE